MKTMVISFTSIICTERCVKENLLDFHQFPLQNNDLHRKCEIAMKRADFKATLNSFVQVQFI